MERLLYLAPVMKESPLRDGASVGAGALEPEVVDFGARQMAVPVQGVDDPDIFVQGILHL